MLVSPAEAAERPCLGICCEARVAQRWLIHPFERDDPTMHDHLPVVVGDLDKRELGRELDGRTAGELEHPAVGHAVADVQMARQQTVALARSWRRRANATWLRRSPA